MTSPLIEVAPGLGWPSPGTEAVSGLGWPHPRDPIVDSAGDTGSFPNEPTQEVV
jgi:hypothetical protein